ncbi:MAG TPA: hypothetical protein VEG61_02000 [Candidatus Dormibacteraeota bacterium]|nr:hypothetical protein [Candidatus Dormibacteraeota bacterium]
MDTPKRYETSLVEEKAAKELKKLFSELVDHSHGHHQAIDGLSKRLTRLEQRVRSLEHRKK